MCGVSFKRILPLTPLIWPCICLYPQSSTFSPPCVLLGKTILCERWGWFVCRSRWSRMCLRFKVLSFHKFRSLSVFKFKRLSCRHRKTCRLVVSWTCELAKLVRGENRETCTFLCWGEAQFRKCKHEFAIFLVCNGKVTTSFTQNANLIGVNFKIRL